MPGSGNAGRLLSAIETAAQRLCPDLRLSLVVCPAQGGASATADPREAQALAAAALAAVGITAPEAETLELRSLSSPIAPVPTEMY
jgi:hypothetical protein